MDLAKGANAPLPEGPLSVRVRSGAARMRLAAYVLGADGRVSGDADVVWDGHPAEAGDALRFARDPDGSASFSLDPSRLRAGAERVAFAATLDPAATRVPGDAAAVVEGAGGFSAAFAFGADAGAERSVIVLEAYRRAGAWKVRAVGQGFADGATALAAHFGAPPTTSGPWAAPGRSGSVPPTGRAEAATAAPVPGRVSLSKVTLDKARPSIDLSKDDVRGGEPSVNLNWNRGGSGRGRAIDLDLACLYEMADGTKGVVQALGDSFGSLDRRPFVRLDGDDRTGAVADGEWLRVAGARWGELRRLLVYAFIYEGVPDWSATDGVVTLRVPGSPAVEVRLDGDGARHPLCAVALVENAGGAMRVTRRVEYFADQAVMDAAYGWGLRWRAGTK